ncbi:MAG: hypothetical protein EXS25_02745 [Pedosphaera sp.]|nr:hypothetical protein [Pedosphaera sp.]
MPSLLHILNAPSDPFVEAIIAEQKGGSTHQVTVIDLTAADPDFAALVELVFQSDSIQCW